MSLSESSVAKLCSILFCGSPITKCWGPLVWTLDRTFHWFVVSVKTSLIRFHLGASVWSALQNFCFIFFYLECSRNRPLLRLAERGSKSFAIGGIGTQKKTLSLSSTDHALSSTGIQRLKWRLKKMIESWEKKLEREREDRERKGRVIKSKISLV